MLCLDALILMPVITMWELFMMMVHVNMVMNATQIVGQITYMMLKKGKNLIISANPINIFNDEVALGKGMKSVTFSIEFQHQSKTLEDKDVTPIINEIIRVAEKEFLAKLRT